MESKSKLKYGFNPKLEEAHSKPEDYIFGASFLPDLAEIPEEEREK